MSCFGSWPCRVKLRAAFLIVASDQRAREADAAVVAIGGAGPRQRLDAAGDGVGEADRFEQRQHRLVDALQIVLAQRLVPAAFQSGADRPDIVGQRRRAQRAARFAGRRTLRDRWSAAAASASSSGSLTCEDLHHIRSATLRARIACASDRAGLDSPDARRLCTPRPELGQRVWASSYCRARCASSFTQPREADAGQAAAAAASSAFRRPPAGVRPQSPVRGCPARCAGARSRRCRAA